jgi:transmembrane sensor
MQEELADILIFKYLEGACSEEEKQRLEEWLAEDEQNRRHFDQIAAIRLELDHIDFHLEPETEAEWDKFRQAIAVAPEQKQKTEARRITLQPSRTARLMRIAAAVAVVVVAGWLLTVYVWNIGGGPVAYVIEVPKGSSRQVELPDGSIVRLNADSKLTIDPDYGRPERRLSLSGEAYFEVEPDPQSPFIVQAEEAYAQVLGTAFNVKAYPENPGVEVAVVEGRVRFRTEAEEGLILEKEMAAGYNKNAGRFEQRTFDAQSDLDWLDGRLVFKDTPLGEVFLALERKYALSIADQTGLTGRLYSDTIEKGDPIESFLDRLALSFGISYRKEQGRIILYQE